MEFVHVPVLLNQVIESLNINPDGLYVDCTVGGAGHSKVIASHLSEKGFLVGLDRDPDAVKIATERLANYNAKVVHANYDEIGNVLNDLNLGKVDGILMDLGVSSYQLDNSDRGFSYHGDSPLDMRMSKSGMSAADLLNSLSEKDIENILWMYGEEKFARRIAHNIIEFRKTKPLETTGEFADIIKESYPQKARREKNPCKKSFQAVRIAVNGEFDHLHAGLKNAFKCLKPYGRMCVITFHSLEDRIVKQQFNEWSKGCICPPDFPICVCGRKPLAKIITKKPIIADDEEIKNNNRSRSAKLRVLERTEEQRQALI